MSYRPIQRLIFTLLMNHENYHHGRRSRGGPGIRTPHFMTVWGPHAGGPPLFGCIHKIFYCRFHKNARKCYITRRVKHCRDSKWCHELVQLMVTSSNDIKIMTSFTYLFECNADTLAVVRNIVSTIKTESCQFGFVVDGTQRVKTELGLNRSQSKRIQTDSSLLFKRIVQSRVPSTTKPNWLKTSEHRRMMVLVTWAANATVARPLSAVSNVPLALCFSTVLRTVQTLLYNTRLPQISLWAIHLSWSKIWVHCIADKESSRNYFLILEFRLIRQTCHWKK